MWTWRLAMLEAVLCGKLEFKIQAPSNFMKLLEGIKMGTRLSSSNSHVGILLG